jgi:heme exporter protein A
VRLLHAEGVALVRGGGLLFEGLDMHLDAGEALHVTGPNGSGKSSLIRLAAGLLRPSAGRIERADKVALADEHLALDRELPLGRALAFWNGGQAPLSAINAMHIADLADVPVRLLSTGQAKRARLARVIAAKASLWLLDEPLNGLDEDGADRLAQAITDHRTGGGAVLAAGHQPLGDGWRRLEIGQ